MLSIQEMEYQALIATQNEMIKIGRIQEIEKQKIKSNNLLYEKLFEPFQNINVNNNDIIDFQEEFQKGNFDDYITNLSKQFNNELNKLHFTNDSSKKCFLKIFLLRKMDKIKNEQFYIKNEELKKEIDEKNISLKEETDEYEELENEKNNEIKYKDDRIIKLRNKCIKKNNTIKNIKICFTISIITVIILQHFINYYGLKNVLFYNIKIVKNILFIIVEIIKYIIVNILFKIINYLITNLYFIFLIFLGLLIGFQFIHVISYYFIFPYLFYRRKI